MFSDAELKEIVDAQIRKDETLGEQAGGSGHLGYVEYEIDEISPPKMVETEEGQGWQLTYSYTLVVTTEFTYYPDNPPYEYKYRKTVVVDNKGELIKESPKEAIGTNLPIDRFIDRFQGGLKPISSDEEGRAPDEMRTQRVIDPQTGRDITGEYIGQRLKELEIIADGIIERAVKDYRKDPEKKKEIYTKAYWEIHEKLGMGSIGPATAAAGPLMNEKKMKLAKSLDVGNEENM